jgi:galactokinase
LHNDLQKVEVSAFSMDQSASILSNSGSALYISFYPSLDAAPAPFPSTIPPAAFVIANSLAISNKAETGKFRYNLRVVETLVGARVLAKVLGLFIEPTRRKTYREVLGEWWTTLGNVDDEATLKGAILNLLESGHIEKLKGKGQEDVTLDEMVEMTSLTKEEFYEIFLSWVTSESVSPHLSQEPDRWRKLRQRISSFTNGLSTCSPKHCEFLNFAIHA